MSNTPASTGKPPVTAAVQTLPQTSRKSCMSPEAAQDEQREVSPRTLRSSLKSLSGGLLGVLGWAASHRLKASLAAAAVLVSIGGALALWLTLTAGPADQEVISEKALEALDRGAYAEARRLAETLRDQEHPSLDALAVAAFVLGATAADEADETWSTDKKYHYLLAARYLEEARDRGFPPGRAADGMFLLGRSLYLSGQLPESRPLLREALKLNPQQKRQIYRLLAGAYLNDANPKYPEALKYNTLYLADRMLPAGERHQGLLQRAQILLHLGKIPECLSALDRIPGNAKNYAEAIVMRGRVLMHEARALEETAENEDPADSRVQALEKYQAAIKTFRLAQGRDTLAAQASRKAMYLIGVCFLETGDSRAALAQFQRICRTYADTPEALAADFQGAELSRQLGRHSDALAAYRRVLKAVGDTKSYSNPWLALDDLRKRMLEAYQYYLDAGNFEICLQLTWALYPAFSPARTMQLTAETYRAWGRSLLARADQLLPSKAEPLARQGRQQLRRAGRAYQRLAKLRVTTRDYPDDLWASAESYREGQDYTSAVKILQQYLKSESRRRRPVALVSLGESLLSLGRIDEALKAFEECIEFHPRDAASFRARLAASQTHFEKGDFEKAEKLLSENLNGDFLTPISKEWRDSLFVLGRLLHTAGRYEEAIRRLEEAVTRYPDTPQATEARYLIGDCYRQRARLAKEELQTNLVENARLAHSKKVYQLLNSALQRYQETQEILSRRQEEKELSSLEKSMLRNCYFAIGDVLFDLGQHEAAAKAYSTATHHYQNAPEVLNAYVQISRAYRRLNKPDQARGALEQAKVVLDRIKTADDFNETTIYSPKEWSELLDWLDTL